jgi:hypothetical protein
MEQVRDTKIATHDDMALEYLDTIITIKHMKPIQELDELLK